MSKTLLLADDSVVIQKLVGLSFANEDVEIVSTDNGDDAVTKAREIRPDLVLADVVMPGKSGYEVCEAIKQDPALAHIPVLLLTGTFEAFDETRAQAAGATGHITKPFEAQALVERVKTVIKQAAPPAPPRAAAPAPPPLADDLFETEEPIQPAPARPSFFGTVESLDVTPSLSEEDLSESLDVDLFGPPGDVGGPTPGAGESFTRAIHSLEVPEAQRFADAPIEDATIALVSEPIEEPVAAPSVAHRAPAAFGDDLGFDDPLDLSIDAPLETGLDAAFEVPRSATPLPPAAFDLDSAFDPAPPSAPSALSFGANDANAATSRSLGRPAPVADLDELLAAPEPVRVPPPIPAAAHPASLPEAPTLLDLGPAEQSGSDLDFGFDVSEQATLSKVDLLEESFSSLLDVSESQILGDSQPSFETPVPAPTPRPAQAPAPVIAPAREPVADFDVSSSDLATAAPLFASPPPIPSAPPVAPVASVAPGTGAARADAAVSHLSPMLQQQVQETLEKVAWEAFSDLSETIVKQVIERVERIAWEVIPQMAETLVREEIRKMKGEND